MGSWEWSGRLRGCEWRARGQERGGGCWILIFVGHRLGSGVENKDRCGSLGVEGD